MTRPYISLLGLGACVAIITSCGGGDVASGGARPASCDRLAVGCSFGDGGTTSPDPSTGTPPSTAPDVTWPNPGSEPAPVPVDNRPTSPFSIQFGTGNSIITYSATMYKKDYSILVTDASGNPVSGVTVTASAWPVAFGKGVYRWLQLGPSMDDGIWVIDEDSFTGCNNEDANRNGILEPGEDVNNNGMLEPGVPVAVNSGGTTNIAGIANISLVYPKDRANWTLVELTIRGAVSGTESVAKSILRLPGLGEDYSKRQVSPPGDPSPHGTGSCTDWF